MKPLEPTDADLRAIMTPAECREADGLALGMTLGTMTTPSLERLAALETTVLARWQYQPENHLAIPGPGYWDYRCLQCSRPVDDHITIRRYFLRKVRAWLK